MSSAYWIEKDYTFVGDNAYSAPVVIESSGTTKTPYFLLRDYLGTITHIANNSGSLIYEYSYDACSVKLGFCKCSETKT